MAGGIVLCDPCLFDETETEAVGFCGICVEYLCKGCIKDHRKAKMTRNHKIKLDDIPRNAEVIKEMIELKVCPLHNDMDITYRCNDHYAYVCTVCRVDSHRNCENVFEIAKAETTDTVLKDIQENLTEINEKADAMGKRIEENKFSLMQKQTEVLHEQEAILQKAIDALEEMKVKCRRETNEKVEAAMFEIDNDLEAFEVIKKSSIRHQGIVEAALKYDHDSCSKVIGYRLKDNVTALKRDLKTVQQKSQFKITFEGNPDCFSISSPGTVSVTQDTREDGANSQNKSKCSIEKSSDELSEAGTAAMSVGRGVVGKAMLSTPKTDIVVDKNVTLVNVRGPNENKVCSILGSVVLPDGRLVVIDYENSSMKLLSASLVVLDIIRLPGRPIRICSIGDYAIAASFERVKRINRYSVNNNDILYDGGFATSLFNHGIAYDGSNIVAIMSDVDFTADRAKDDLIQLEVRDITNGTIVDVIDDFKVVGKKSWSLVLISTQAVCSTPDCGIILAEQNRLLRFSLSKASLKTVAVENDFYVCSGEIEKNDIDNIASDGTSVYVCMDSGCVLQLSISDFRKNRVILSDVADSLRSICVDNTSSRIILGRANDDNIHVYSFTRTP